ncbi:MAG: bifunctional lysylphosphatidylglycerol flippase/synthetase MprF [Steroidobacteraceae bacterium]
MKNSTAQTAELARRGLRWITPLISIAAFALVAWVLHRELADYHVRDILAQMRSVPASTLLAAVVLTALSYLVLTGFDWLGVQYAGKPLPYGRTALTAFIAYAFGHNLNLAAFTGAAVRYRMYSSQGYTTLDVAMVVSFCALTSAIGLSVVSGVALLTATAGTTALHLGHFWAQIVGLLLIGWVLVYQLWSMSANAPLAIGSWTLRPPGGRLSLPQLLLGVADLNICAGVLWLMLPSSVALDFPTFAGVFAIAVVGGLLSQLPGGIGVFEAILLVALPQLPAPQLLGALLAYRVVYYLVPLALAALCFAAHEIYVQHRRVLRVGDLAQRYLSTVLMPVAPQLIGVFVFVAGAVLLVSGATPAIDERLLTLRRFVPLPLLEASHLAGSVIGVGLLILARGLFRRLNAAYHVTFWLLVAGIGASLLKGLDFEEALYLALVLLVTWLTRPAFYRPSSILSQRFSPGWIASIAVIVGLSLWLSLLSHRRVPYTNELWWTFALHGDAPRALRASLAVLVAIGAFSVAHWLRPARLPPHDAESIDYAGVKQVLATADASLGNAALAGDKRVLFHPSAEAFLMYQVAGSSWVALGDPVGNPAHLEELLWIFRERVDLAGGRAVFYQIGPRHLPSYLDLGLTLIKLGEEARVPLQLFSLDGSARAGLRQSCRRAERDGASFELIGKSHVPQILPRLRAISDAWLEDKATAEKGFSLGAFSEEYIAQFPVAVVKCHGEIVAFANLWPAGSGDELSIDLMRFSDDAPRSSMEYLFAELMLWGRSQGFRWFNLGMAPLSGLENRALAPTWHRMGSFLYRHGEAFYNFEGLRRFKQKFDPEWEPRYLASPGGLTLPRVLFDVSTLISGGIRELVSK